VNGQSQTQIQSIEAAGILTACSPAIRPTDSPPQCQPCSQVWSPRAAPPSWGPRL